MDKLLLGENQMNEALRITLKEIIEKTLFSEEFLNKFATLCMEKLKEEDAKEDAKKQVIEESKEEMKEVKPPKVVKKQEVFVEFPTDGDNEAAFVFSIFFNEDETLGVKIFDKNNKKDITSSVNKDYIEILLSTIQASEFEFMSDIYYWGLLRQRELVEDASTTEKVEEVFESCQKYDLPDFDKLSCTPEEMLEQELIEDISDDTEASNDLMEDAAIIEE